MKIRAFLTAAVFAIPIIATAQTPRYTPQFLGPALPGRMNSSAEVIGRVSEAGSYRGVVLRAGQPYQLLPLPDGMASSYARDISDLGVVVGQVGPLSSPEFSGRAAAWYPDGHGDYSVVVFGVLPGSIVSGATAVNNLGDIVGYSGDGTFRHPVYFHAPDDLVDLTSYGIFDPVGINDQRVLVDNSSTAKRLDLDTMVVEDLGIPDPPGDTNYRATWSVAINESSQVAGAAILTTSTSCDREVARYTDGVGWEIFSMCGPNNSASDLNDRGDMVMRIGLSPYVYFEGGGTFELESLIVNDIGFWYAASASLGAINNTQKIVIYATNPTTGQTGALLLTPESATGVDSVGSSLPPPQPNVVVAPNPFNPRTTVSFTLPVVGHATLAIYDARGLEVARLADETLSAGTHSKNWNGRDTSGAAMPSGTYFCRLSTPWGEETTKMVLIR